MACGTLAGTQGVARHKTKEHGFIKRFEMKINKIIEGRHDGEVNCPACYTRFWLKQGVKKVKCPGCGMEWKISRPYPRTVKVRGPNWETCPTGDKI